MTWWNMNVVYLVGLSNGLVKVGYSENFNKRPSGIARDVKIMFPRADGHGNVRINRVDVVTTDGNREFEKRCIALLKTKAKLAAKREYFSGISFDDAMDLLRAELPVQEQS